jgi:toxin ParE1/3/4
MAYLVELTARAARDLEILYVEKNAAESYAAARWFNGLEKAMDTLAAHPHRCPVIPEATKIKRELRHLLYGRKPHIYRVIFDIDEKQQNMCSTSVTEPGALSVKSICLEEIPGQSVDRDSNPPYHKKLSPTPMAA